MPGPDHAGWVLQSRRLAVSLNTTFVSVMAGHTSKSQMRIIKKKINKNKERVCGAEDCRVSRMHNKRRATERVGGRESERETTPPTCNPTHAHRGLEVGSAADGYKSRPHDERRGVETLEYHHLSQQWCPPQAGFMALNPVRHCK